MVHTVNDLLAIGFKQDEDISEQLEWQQNSICLLPGNDIVSSIQINVIMMNLLANKMYQKRKTD